MRLAALTVALLAALAACAPVDEAHRERGPVAWHRAERELVLAGERYHVPETVNTTWLRSGDEVRLVWEQQGDRRVVTDLDVEEPFVIFGF